MDKEDLPMELTARYLPILEQVLTAPRLRHSIGVMQVMEDLTDIYRLDPQQAITAGLLHDAAKDLPEAKWQQMVVDHGIALHEPADANYALYLHGPVGAQFVQQTPGVSDPLVLDAIRMHTYYGSGENFQHPLVWCLRFADILEPNRDWTRVPALAQNGQRLKEMVYTGRLQAAALLQTRCIIEMFEQQGLPVHPNMRRVLRELSIELHGDEWNADPLVDQPGD